MSMRNTIFAFSFLLVSSFAWSTVFIRWTSSSLPPTAAEFGITDLVIPWSNSFQAQGASGPLSRDIESMSKCR